MTEKRISVYGKDAEGKRKRAFDWLELEDGQLVVETITRDGHKVIIPINVVEAALKQLQKPPGLTL